MWLCMQELVNAELTVMFKFDCTPFLERRVHLGISTDNPPDIY